MEEAFQDIEHDLSPEAEQRRESAITWISNVWPKYKVLDALQSTFGIARPTAIIDYNRAKAKMRLEDDTPRKEKQSKISAFLERVLQNTEVSARVKIRAVREYVRLHGLQETRPISEDEKEDIQVTFNGDWRENFRKRVETNGKT